MKNTPIKAAVITVSDTRTTENDTAGNLLVENLTQLGAEVLERVIVSDDLGPLRNTIHHLTEREDINLIVTAGGTGLGPRDNTPEATQAVIEKEIPGMAEAMRALTLMNTPMAMLSRAICGSRGRTLIINLPGSQKAVDECFQVVRPVIQHALNLLAGQTDH